MCDIQMFYSHYNNPAMLTGDLDSVRDPLAQNSLSFIHTQCDSAYTHLVL
jgi:hypothetical protein